uniref:F-box domain-containing protein n=1 Tax=Setaria digitata TaxID=48799 RepID=A0A915PUN1_9BILA
MDAITESPGRFWPVSRKYDTINRKYKFFEATHTDRMQSYYPLIQLGRTAYSPLRFGAIGSKSQISVENEIDVEKFATDSNIRKGKLAAINDLPDDILLAIFRYCHPIELIHCFSPVSQRWNSLANHATLFTEVRVLINDLSLKYGSVKTFFQRTSQHLQKLCIDCSVSLPSAEVNALFDICCPKVIHLDIGSFKEMNTILLEKLSKCFPNVQTVHMERVKRSSSNDDNTEEWIKTLRMLFEDGSIFPKMRNLFVGDVAAYSLDDESKLPASKRPLNLLSIYEGTGATDFIEIRTSPWTSTLTELHLGYIIRNDAIQYIGELLNLKVFSWGLSLYTCDQEILHLKNLYNLEELRIMFGGEDCNVTDLGLIDLFTLPNEEPEKFFPYKLKHLALENYYDSTISLLAAIDRNCPDLKSLGLAFNGYLPLNEEAMSFIIKNFKRLVFLDLSNWENFYKDEVWNNLDDHDLPDLRLLKIHGNEVNIEDLQRLNLKRSKLLISTRWNYFINWTETENGCVFHDTFDGDIKSLENDLRQIDGLHDFTMGSSLSIYDNISCNPLVRSSSIDSNNIRKTKFFPGDCSV